MRNTMLLTVAAFLFSCASAPDESERHYDLGQVKAQGDSVATHAQKVLLANVSDAIAEGGTSFAVDFCNTRAIPITDSVAEQYGSLIQRLTDKPRNPENAISSPADQQAWDKIKKDKEDFVVQDGEALYYYKPIMIAMTTCLKCHGDKSEIDENTLKAIASKYPADQATGYQAGDLRGMWKVLINTGSIR